MLTANQTIAYQHHSVPTSPNLNGSVSAETATPELSSFARRFAGQAVDHGAADHAERYGGTQTKISGFDPVAAGVSSSSHTPSHQGFYRGRRGT